MARALELETVANLRKRAIKAGLCKFYELDKTHLIKLLRHQGSERFQKHHRSNCRTRPAIQRAAKKAPTSATTTTRKSTKRSVLDDIYDDDDLDNLDDLDLDDLDDLDDLVDIDIADDDNSERITCGGKVRDTCMDDSHKKTCKWTTNKGCRCRRRGCPAERRKAARRQRRDEEEDLFSDDDNDQVDDDDFLEEATAGSTTQRGRRFKLYEGEEEEEEQDPTSSSSEDEEGISDANDDARPRVPPRRRNNNGRVKVEVKSEKRMYAQYQWKNAKSTRRDVLWLDADYWGKGLKIKKKQAFVRVAPIGKKEWWIPMYGWNKKGEVLQHVLSPCTAAPAAAAGSRRRRTLRSAAANPCKWIQDLLEELCNLQRFTYGDEVKGKIDGASFLVTRNAQKSEQSVSFSLLQQDADKRIEITDALKLILPDDDEDDEDDEDEDDGISSGKACSGAIDVLNLSKNLVAFDRYEQLQQSAQLGGTMWEEGDSSKNLRRFVLGHLWVGDGKNDLLFEELNPSLPTYKPVLLAGALNRFEEGKGAKSVPARNLQFSKLGIVLHDDATLLAKEATLVEDESEEDEDEESEDEVKQEAPRQPPVPTRRQSPRLRRPRP